MFKMPCKTGIIILVVIFLISAGCSRNGAPHKAALDPEETSGVTGKESEAAFDENISGRSDYEEIDGDIADVITYNYEDRAMYIAGLKVFEEFGTANEGGASILTDENALTFSMTKSTGTLTGAVDGPHVYFKMDLAANKIIEKKFEPAPDYSEAGKMEFIEHSGEIIELSDEQMLEIGNFFKELILKIEAE
ncbi:MAG TPA: hypothetical protein VEG39_21340 [Clostridia bacterium]|nr:hypothetical protein [Clostridia bacterium]